jgi:hypothetical protein
MKSTKILSGLLFVSIVLSDSTFAAGEMSCSQMADLAGSVMSARQANVDMAQAMHVGQGNKIFKLIVRDAYERPRFETEANQKSAVQDYRNVWYLACIKSEHKD